MRKTDQPDYRERVYDMVRRIPKGRIMTYGQIAITLGDGYTPRTVGYVMRNSDADDVPWQRVINSKGGCSTRRVLAPSNIQQQLLEHEGVKFNGRGFCRIEEYRWEED
jgi:methylated-DNA-protein-cysteine methyltransferase-like protein